MSYKCNICHQPVPHNTLMRRHAVKRPDGTTATEIPVCAECHAGFRSGYTLDQMRKICSPKAEMPEALKDLPKIAPSHQGPPVKPVFVKK